MEICIGMLEVKPSTGVVIYSGRVDIDDKEEETYKHNMPMEEERHKHKAYNLQLHW